MRSLYIVLYGILLVPVLAACSSGDTFSTSEPGAPIYRAGGIAVAPASADALAECLGINTDVLAPDQSIRYLQKDKFQRLPLTELGPGTPDEDNNLTVAQGFDFEAIAELEVLSDDEALSKMSGCLKDTNLLPEGDTSSVGHSRFEAVSKDGEVVADVSIDTQVSYLMTTPEGEPLVGPGAEVKVVFDPDGTVTQLIYANRILKKVGEVPVLPASEAAQLAASQYLDTDAGLITLQDGCATSLQPQSGELQTLCLESELVYYAPPLDLNVEMIVPHYLFEGTLTIKTDEKEEDVQVRKLLLPAVQDAPQLELSVSSAGSSVSAQVTVEGGTAPYSYEWSSSSTALEEVNANSISYTVASREATTEETLSVIVTDANGLIAWTTQSVSVTAEASVSTQSLGRVDAGISWIGLSQGLPRAAANARGLRRVLTRNQIPVQFDNGEEAAQSNDFVDPLLGGQDSTVVDDVDLSFYTGHASGNGFTFTSNQQSQFLFYDEVRWGNRDLEWLLIAACGPLQDSSVGLAWWERWGSAFDGLHMLLAYSTVTFDNDLEGRLFARSLLNERLKVRQAWVQTATMVQSQEEIYAIMGVWGENGSTNYDDHFWDQGTVGPDVPADAVEGYWRLSGPA